MIVTLRSYLNYTNQSIFIIQRMYFLYTTNLITSHKNQPLLFALGG